MNLLERFLKYVSIDTTSNSEISTMPSTPEQRILASLLYEELKDMKIEDIYYDSSNCYVYAMLDGNVDAASVGFVAHVDTSEYSKGDNIKPNIIRNYDGKDIKLDNGNVIKVEDNPQLKEKIGKTIITTDGTTLLGADDKAGIAEIMSMLEHYNNTNEPHGDIYVCFTPDEEIGKGTERLDYVIFNPEYAYTVDGEYLGEFSYENFNAALVQIDIKGIPTHTGMAKNKMLNAVRLATTINELLPKNYPENTEGHEGFIHLEKIDGNVESCEVTYLIRDFDKKEYEKKKELFREIVRELNKKYPNAVKLRITDQYINMYEKIKDNTKFIDVTKEAIEELGIDVLEIPIRGGTDGTDISYNGIPCPNIGTGSHNFHSVYEYVCLEDMEQTKDILINIVKKFAKTKDLKK